jgi:hypothetical protein
VTIATLDDFRQVGREHAETVFADIQRLGRVGKRADIVSTVFLHRAKLAAGGATSEELAAWQHAFTEALERRLAASSTIHNAAAAVLERRLATLLPAKGSA